MGGTPAENAEITRGILSGEIQGTKRNIVLMNAGAALYVGQRTASIGEGVKLAAELIDSGAAMRTLEKVIEVSHS